MQGRLRSFYILCHARLESCDMPAFLRVARYFLHFIVFFPHTVSVVANTTNRMSNAF